MTIHFMPPLLAPGNELELNNKNSNFQEIFKIPPLRP